MQGIFYLGLVSSTKLWALFIFPIVPLGSLLWGDLALCIHPTGILHRLELSALPGSCICVCPCDPAQGMCAALDTQTPVGTAPSLSLVAYVPPSVITGVGTLSRSSVSCPHTCSYVSELTHANVAKPLRCSPGMLAYSTVHMCVHVCTGVHTDLCV